MRVRVFRPATCFRFRELAGTGSSRANLTTEHASRRRRYYYYYYKKRVARYAFLNSVMYVWRVNDAPTAVPIRSGVRCGVEDDCAGKKSAAPPHGLGA